MTAKQIDRRTLHQRKRTTAANEFAQMLGFPTMGKMVTAYMNGQIIIDCKAEDSSEIVARITVKK